jgi:uncharacterized repeat protein (TIGR03803 family)
MTKSQGNQRPEHSVAVERLLAARAALAFVLIVSGIATQPAQAQTYYSESVLHSFSLGSDGGYPWAGLVQDAKGNLYGTTSMGGALMAGTVFKVSSKGDETVLYTFEGSKDGGTPYADLIQDAKANLYGTTYVGGAFNRGVVFKVSSKGTETVLYTFTGGADGGSPYAGLVRDAKENLYGTTSSGGSFSNSGVVFKVSSKGKEAVLYTFTGGVDGGNPYAGLVQDAKGILYGTTLTGGDLSCNPPYGCGTVFKVTKTGKETVLDTFTGGADGGYPYAGLVQDAEGNLYGTTVEGGDLACNPPYGCGTAFKVTKTGKETVLYSFTGGADGGYPYAGLVRDAKGNLYGTTSTGGALEAGVVFRVSSKGKETVLYTFTGGVDGASPLVLGRLVQDEKGRLYGTTELGGASTFGTVFKLIP